MSSVPLKVLRTELVRQCLSDSVRSSLTKFVSVSQTSFANQLRQTASPSARVSRDCIPRWCSGTGVPRWRPAIMSHHVPVGHSAKGRDWSLWPGARPHLRPVFRDVRPRSEESLCAFPLPGCPRCRSYTWHLGAWVYFSGLFSLVSEAEPSGERSRTQQLASEAEPSSPAPAPHTRHSERSGWMLFPPSRFPGTSGHAARNPSSLFRFLGAPGVALTPGTWAPGFTFPGFSLVSEAEPSSS